MSRIATDLTVSGTLRATNMVVSSNSVSNASIKADADIERSKMKQEPLTAYDLRLATWKVWDALGTNLPSAGATDDLALSTGTLGTDSPTIQTGDLKAAGATTRYARTQFQLPIEYDPAETVNVRFSAGMLTTVSDTTATIDVEVYESDRIGAVGSDLVTTAATTINSLTLADIDFVVTASGLAPLDVLDIRVAIAINDAATGTAVIGLLAAAEMLCDVRG